MILLTNMESLFASLDLSRGRECLIFGFDFEYCGLDLGFGFQILVFFTSQMSRVARLHLH